MSTRARIHKMKLLSVYWHNIRMPCNEINTDNHKVMARCCAELVELALCRGGKMSAGSGATMHCSSKGAWQAHAGGR